MRTNFYTSRYLWNIDGLVDRRSCRRRPPPRMIIPAQKIECGDEPEAFCLDGAGPVWPKTFPDDWCGEHASRSAQ